MREEVELLKNHSGFHADRLDVVDVLGERDAIHDDVAGFVFFEAIDGADQGRLAAAGRADDDDDLFGLDRKADVA